MAVNDGRFTSENQPKGRGKSKKTLMLEAIRAHCGTEQEFLERVIVAGLGDPKNEVPSNPALLSLVLNRIEPPLKAISPMIEFDFRRNAKPHEQAADVLSAVSDGLIAPDVGQMFIASIQSMLKIQEVTDIDDRLKAMEAQIESSE